MEKKLTLTRRWWHKVSFVGRDRTSFGLLRKKANSRLTSGGACRRRTRYSLLRRRACSRLVSFSGYKWSTSFSLLTKRINSRLMSNCREGVCDRRTEPIRMSICRKIARKSRASFSLFEKRANSRLLSIYRKSMCKKSNRCSLTSLIRTWA